VAWMSPFSCFTATQTYASPPESTAGTSGTSPSRWYAIRSRLRQNRQNGTQSTGKCLNKNGDYLMEPLNKTCESCNQTFGAVSVSQTECVQCMLRPHRKPVTGGVLMTTTTITPQKVCEKCKKPYTPTGNRQIHCSDCREVPATPKVPYNHMPIAQHPMEPPFDVPRDIKPPKAVLGPIVSPLETMAESLLQMSGDRPVTMSFASFTVVVSRTTK
jgi:hypothetical protein